MSAIVDEKIQIFGDSVAEIYATKAKLPAMNFSITTLEGSPCLLITDGTTTYKFVGAEVIDGG